MHKVKYKLAYRYHAKARLSHDTPESGAVVIPVGYQNNFKYHCCQTLYILEKEIQCQ